MGTWGVGLYSSDFAMDLRSAVSAVVRLPFEPERLLDTLRQAEPEAADNPADPDYTVFWLSVADLFARKGVDCPTARERALAIIADGADLATMTSLGMDEKSLAKRRVMLEGLGARLAEPVAEKRRPVLKAPQKLLLEVGEVLTYPVCCTGDRCEPINPYAVGKEWDWVKAWKQNGWGALVVVERGRLFDYLAWYRLLAAHAAEAREPTLADLEAPRAWQSQRVGTLTARHYANLQLKSLGRIDIDPARLKHVYPDWGVPFGSVVSDISIANALYCHAKEPDSPFWDMSGEAIRPGLRALADIEPGADAPEPGNLSGPWRGEYSDDGDDDPPRAFVAELREIGGLVRGRIDEAATAIDKPGRPLEAIVEGRRAGQAVRLIKRYESAARRFIPILYEGEVSEGGDTVAGRWTLRTGRTGPFVMSRR